jgi:hypothetical protein
MPMSAQLDKQPGLVLFLSLLATVCGPIFRVAAEEKSAPEQLPLPTEVVDTLSDPLPPGAVARLGSPGLRQSDLEAVIDFSA